MSNSVLGLGVQINGTGSWIGGLYNDSSLSTGSGEVQPKCYRYSVHVPERPLSLPN